MHYFFFWNIWENIHLTTNNINIDIQVPLPISGHEIFNFNILTAFH